ncbi:MAG: magnesium/cobalt transporter CorA [Candidatus Thorarchaeota archaeon]|nr:magnesium/cobalt transporter CorA [Candidatus Thorarchaeota archaeon]
MSENRATKAGLPPGTVVHTGPKRVDKVSYRIVDYNEKNLEVITGDTPDQCVPLKEEGFTRWVHVNGVHEVDKIEKMASNFGIHPLVIEDISSTSQRPKVEILKDGVYVVLKAFTYDDEKDTIYSEQISIILGKNFVLSFQESADDIFEPILKRILLAGSRLRRTLSDYLTYALVDLIVDNYFVVLEVTGDKIEELEDAIVNSFSEDYLARIYDLKRSLLMLRKFIWPLREVVFRLNRDEATLIEEETQIYLRDLYDHVIRATDHVETYRDSLTTMLDIYLTNLNNRMNDIMKILTVISTIFIPATFLASIYGMNFVFMGPELQWVYGYPMLLFSMLFIGIILLAYFRKIRWI